LKFISFFYYITQQNDLDNPIYLRVYSSFFGFSFANL